MLEYFHLKSPEEREDLLFEFDPLGHLEVIQKAGSKSPSEIDEMIYQKLKDFIQNQNHKDLERRQKFFDANKK